VPSRGVNKVLLIGRLGQPPEMRYTQAGVPSCRFTLATDSYAGGGKVVTQWHTVMVWGFSSDNPGQAEECGERLAKGVRVGVEGEIRYRKWKPESGGERWMTEIHASNVIFLDEEAPGEGPTAAGEYS
jgi:single-strand DNA-binding protein